MLRDFFFATVARFHFAQIELLEFTVKVFVATKELCHIVDKSYLAVLKPILDCVEVVDDTWFPVDFNEIKRYFALSIIMA